MKPAPFEYVVPSHLEEALALMSEHGDAARPLAGGQSLIPVMNFRLAQPSVLVDLNRIADFATIDHGHNGLTIRAMTRQAAVEKSPLVAEHAPLLHEVMPWIAHSQIRNRGTIGGSLAHADPAAELPVIAVALDARFKLERAGSARWVNAVDFYQDLFMTALEPEELLTEIIFPDLPAGSGWAFLELARRHGDYAQAGVAAIMQLDGEGRCQSARLVFLNAGNRPVVAPRAAALLQGEIPSEDVLTAAAELAAREEIEPTGDVHATEAYKRHLAGVLARRALRTATARAGKKQQAREP